MDKVGVDDELRCGAGEVGRVPLPARQGPGLGLQFPVDARGGPGELDVAVALDRGFPLDSAFGLGDLFVDAAQRAPRPVAAELVADDTVGDATGLLAAGGRLGLVNTSPSGMSSSGCLSRHSRTTSGTGWSIKKFVRTARRYRTVKIKAGRQTLTAADPLPDDLRDALAKIGSTGVH